MTGKKRPLLIALHGWGARGAFFENLAQRLADTCDVVAPDFAGHGCQQMCDDVSLSRLADQVDRLVSQNAGRELFLLGWSMGAAAALTYLQHFGQGNVTGLIIEDMSPKPLNDNDWKLGIGNGYAHCDIDETVSNIQSGWRRYAQRVWRATFATPTVAKQFATDPLYEAFLDNREAPMANAWQSLMELDARSLVTRLDMPVLVVMGKQSHVYGPDLADWYDDNLRNSSVLRLEGAGHAPHLEQPDIFAKAVETFMQTRC